MSDTDSYRSMTAIFLQDRQVSSRRSNDRRIADQASSPAAPRSTGSGPTKGPVVLIQTPTGAGTLRAPNPPEVTKDPSVDEDIDELDGFFPPGLFADVVDSSGALRYGREYVYGVGAAGRGVPDNQISRGGASRTKDHSLNKELDGQPGVPGSHDRSPPRPPTPMRPTASSQVQKGPAPSAASVTGRPNNPPSPNAGSGAHTPSPRRVNAIPIRTNNASYSTSAGQRSFGVSDQEADGLRTKAYQEMSLTLRQESATEIAGIMRLEKAMKTALGEGYAREIAGIRKGEKVSRAAFEKGWSAAQQAFKEPRKNSDEPGRKRLRS